MVRARIIPNVLEVITGYICRKSTVQSKKKLAYLKSSSGFVQELSFKSTRVLKTLMEIGNSILPFATHWKPSQGVMSENKRHPAGAGERVCC